MGGSSGLADYGDKWFDQRTLTARFEMNLTDTVEVIPKPILNLMAMLALLGDTKHPVSPLPTPESSPIGVIATSSAASPASPAGDAGQVVEVAVLAYNSGELGEDCQAHCNASLEFRLAGLGGLRNGVMRHFQIDDGHGNPRATWSSFGGAANPYPTPAQFVALRASAELSLLASGPVTPAPIGPDGHDAGLNLSVTLPQPGVALLHICLLKTDALPAPPAKVGQVLLRATPTKAPPTTFVRWAPASARCLAGYDVVAAPSTAGPAGPYTSVAAAAAAAGGGGGGGSLFAYYVHAQSELAAVPAGCFKVRAVDVWGQAGEWSDAACH